MANFLFIIAFAIFIGGVLLFGTARSGPQNTLGGIVAMVALVIAALGALCRVAGL